LKPPSRPETTRLEGENGKMNDVRRQLLHEAFKLVDLVIMICAFTLAVWVFSRPDDSLMQEKSATAPFASPSGADGAVLSSPSAAGLPATSGTVIKSVPPDEPSAAQRHYEALLRFVTMQNVLTVMGMLFVWHLTFGSRRLYHSDRLDSPLVEALEVFRAGLVAGLVIVLISFGSFPQLQLDPVGFFVTFFIFSTGTTIVARLLMRLILERLRLRGRNLRSLLVVGTNSRAIRFAETVKRRPELGYYVEGFVDEDWDGMESFLGGGGKLVAGLKNLGSYLGSHVVDEVVVALPVSSAYIHSKRIVSLCMEQGITVRFISQIFDPRLAKGKMDVFQEEPMITLMAEPDRGFAKVAKKLIDVFASAIALVLLAPLLLCVAIGIKLSMPGPVFFVQKRVGLNKRLFSLFKFRTMVVDAEARLKEIEHLNQVEGPVFKIEKDPRVTRFGEFLRKTSLDELPQLLNVLFGDMSLVGPRPLPLRDYEGFDDDSHRRRLSVRPGITCLWQVRGRNSIPFDQWMKLDLEYIDNWSLWLDLKLMLETVPVVLGPLVFGHKGEFMKAAAAAAAAENRKK
jgi:exopolysaccharide biosynthesis polyprenyl glycosylphosphotransferase